MLPAHPPSARRQRFQTTQWSVVRAAARRDEPSGRDALSTICEAYWYPLYSYVRRFGHGPDAAADLTQEFFARLIERNDLAAVREERGRFRSYLLGALKHFLLNEAARATRLKRTSRTPLLQFDFTDAESAFRREPADARTPETVFERTWALTALARAIAALQERWTSRGRGREFALLKPTLLSAPADYAALATTLGLTVNATQVAVHRIRRDFRDALRTVVGDTLLSTGAIDAEIAELLAALDRL